MREVLSAELRLGAFNLGSDLASPDQIIYSAVKQLNINLVDIGCEPSVDSDQVRGSWQSAMLTQNTPPFSRAVRGATSSIIWRPENLAGTMPPIGAEPVKDSDGNNTQAVWVKAEDVDLEEALYQSLEGAIWVDPVATERRVSFAERNSAILKSFLGGLATEGYARSRAKGDMREEFDEVLDSLWRRGSYHCFSETRVVASTMRKAGLSNLSGIPKTLRRLNSFGKDYGYGLALMRMLPESWLAELE